MSHQIHYKTETTDFIGGNVQFIKTIAFAMEKTSKWKIALHAILCHLRN
jgi:hypothetical protein